PAGNGQPQGVGNAELRDRLHHAGGNHRDDSTESARMPGRAKRVKRTALKNIASNWAFHAASETSVIGPGGGPPVLRTRISTCASRSARLSIVEASLRSQARALMDPRPGGHEAASSFKRSRLRARATTLAPSLASAKAIALPKPREAPA